MALVGRIIVILFALWLATIAAGIVWSVGLLGSQWSALSGDVGERIVFWGAAFIASSVTATLLFLPMLIAVVVAEAFKVRSLLIHVVAAVALFLLAYQGAGLGRSGRDRRRGGHRIRAYLLADRRAQGRALARAARCLTLRPIDRRFQAVIAPK